MRCDDGDGGGVRDGKGTGADGAAAAGAEGAGIAGAGGAALDTGGAPGRADSFDWDGALGGGGELGWGGVLNCGATLDSCAAGAGSNGLPVAAQKSRRFWPLVITSGSSAGSVDRAIAYARR